MLEREMEDLIAANPEHFFPRNGFVLQGRQQSFQGVGRFDLLFTDRYGMNILMELKAVPARYEVIDQVARYRDALVAKGNANIIMWIVAPSVPHSIRDFLSTVGVEYTEIHTSEFRRIAALTGYTLRDGLAEKPVDQTSEMPTDETVPPEIEQRKLSIQRSGHGGIDEWGFGTGTQPSFLIQALEAGGMTKERLRSEYIGHFFPTLSYAEAKGKSGFNVFFSDSKRPVCTYHASRALRIIEDRERRLSLDLDDAEKVKAAIRAGILDRLRGVHFLREKQKFDEIQREFGLPTEP